MTHTYACTRKLISQAKDFKKPGAPACDWCASGLIKFWYLYSTYKCQLLAITDKTIVTELVKYSLKVYEKDDHD